MLRVLWLVAVTTAIAIGATVAGGSRHAWIAACVAIVAEFLFGLCLGLLTGRNDDAER